MKPLLVSDHARQRIKERLNTSDRKIQKLVQKAWNSKDVENPKAVWTEYKSKIVYENENRICKSLMGYVFLFAENRDSIVLVTVF
jgi:hypothetical protein